MTQTCFESYCGLCSKRESLSSIHIAVQSPQSQRLLKLRQNVLCLHVRWRSVKQPWQMSWIDGRYLNVMRDLEQISNLWGVPVTCKFSSIPVLRLLNPSDVSKNVSAPFWRASWQPVSSCWDPLHYRMAAPRFYSGNDGCLHSRTHSTRKENSDLRFLVPSKRLECIHPPDVFTTEKEAAPSATGLRR